MKNKKFILLITFIILLGLTIIYISTNAFDKFVCSSNDKIDEKQIQITNLNKDTMGTIEENNPEQENKKINYSKIKLPEPVYSSNTSVEEVLSKRKSIRDFQKKPLSIENISQILWAAQGITDKGKNKRTAPSAGALYPLEIYILIGNVKEIESGIYKYKPHQHEMVLIAAGDKRGDLAKYCAQPEAIQTAPITLVFAAVYERTSVKYGQRAERYVHIEVGHASQNVCLQVISLNLGTVTIGAFQDSYVKKTVQMLQEEDPLYVMPIGYVR